MQPYSDLSSNNIIQRDKSAIWHPFSPLKGGFPVLPVKSAKAEFLYLHDGREIIDGISSWWVNIHGHSHPEMAEAIYRQALQLEHVIFAGFTHEPAVSIAEKLKEIMPNKPELMFFSDNGSTAVEVALKMAIQYHKNLDLDKPVIIALEGAYHGDTFGAMALGDRGPFTEAFNEQLFDVVFLPFPDTERNERAALLKLQQLVSKHKAGIFIYEPLVQGAAGMRMYSAQWLEQALLICADAEFVRIADEVFTGFYRSGKCFASEHLNTQADIICVSKGLSGGMLPLGITAPNARIKGAFDTDERLKTLYHGHSFTANPIACAAAIKSLEILQRPESLKRIAFIGESHRAFSKKIAESKCIQKLSIQGTILSIELKAPGHSGYFNELREIIYNFFLDRGILLRPLGNTIYFLPPYCTCNESLEKVYDSILAFLAMHENRYFLDAN
jgi:adenosylmethionine-8-amino-7-oxononanoate aminotransferase